jgi:hypothetical protein
MRVARVGSIRLATAIGVTVALAAGSPAAAPGAAPTTTTKPSFKVTISPEYTTAGQPTTFQITVVNTSPRGTTLGSAKFSPPKGFTPPQPTPGSSLSGKAKVQDHAVTLRHISLGPGKQAQLSVTATAPANCGGGTGRHWTTQAFEAQNGSGAQLALNGAVSSLGVKVLCPAAAACGDGGPPCSTNLVTSNSTYAVISDAASGTLNQTVNVGGQMRCGNHHFSDPNWYDSFVSPAATAPPSPTPAAAIVDEVTYKIRNATAKGIGFCLGAAYDFVTASGAQAPAGKLPNGKSGFVGLLPMCTSAKPPCISSISQRPDSSTPARHDVLMKIQIPESGDPWGRA